MFIPALNGLGAPFWDGNVRGSIENVSSGTTKEEIIRSAFEAIAFSTKAIIETIEKTINLQINELKIDGGLSKSSFFSQYLADLIGKKVKASKNSEMTSLGVAKLSLEKSGISPDIKNSYNEYNPKNDKQNIYLDKYKKWKKLIEKKIKN